MRVPPDPHRPKGRRSCSGGVGNLGAWEGTAAVAPGRRVCPLQKETVMSARPTVAVLGACLLMLAGPNPASAWDHTPAVDVYVTPYGAGSVGDEAETPESPLAAEVSAGSGGNTAFGRAVPGALKLSTAIVNGPDPWSMSHAVARFADHFHLTNPSLGQNARGAFYFRFVLTGTMSILASDWQSGASVAVGAYAWNQQYVGQLNFYRVGETPTLYGLSGMGGDFPENNLLANPDGSMKIYATATTPVNGYYTVHVNVPIAFPIVNFPINGDPQLNGWDNWVQIEFSLASFRTAICDFSSTCAFADQNPIVPNPEDVSLPVAGWQFASASDEIALPPVSTLMTSTGTGEMAVVPDRGVMSGLTALTQADFPEGLSDGNFEHGWLGLDLAGFTAGEMAIFGFDLPGNMGPGSVWWYHDGAQWQSLPLFDDDGDSFLVLLVTDNGPGDLDPTAGAITLRGGITDEAPTPLMLESFVARCRDGGVDLSWRAPSVDPARLALTGNLGGASWPVAVTGDGSGNITARDEAPALRHGGAVRYDLALDGALVDSRTVEVALPRLQTALVGIAPNPCNPQAVITFAVDRAQVIDLAVFDLAGRRVATLAGGTWEAGEHSVTWRGRDTAGRLLPSGSYAVRLESAQGRQARKLSLVR